MYKNVLSNPESVLEEIENGLEEWEAGGVAESRYEEYLKTNPTEQMRNVYVKYLPFYEFDATSDLQRRLIKEINDAFDVCESDYVNSTGISLKNHEGYQIVKYNPGQYFKEHVDATKEFPRKLSTVYYFNDDYTGGEIFFPNLNILIKPEKNSMIVFPSSEAYRHSARPVISGTKYGIVGFWY